LHKGLSKVIKPSIERLSRYPEQTDKPACARTIPPSLPQSHDDQHHTPPVDTPPHEQAGLGGTSSSATLPAAAQALSDAIVLWNWRSTSWFASIIGLMKWPAAIGASRLTFMEGKVGVDKMKKVEKTCSFKKF
jgi:hypothetical protein